MIATARMGTTIGGVMKRVKELLSIYAFASFASIAV
jgi:hypothetical protein